MSTYPRNLIIQLRKTAERLKQTDEYRWTHQGRCNCGHLAQTLTGHSAARLHQMAVRSEGEWADHARGYCETSQQPIDEVIRQMLAFGITVEELADLEHLRSQDVLKWMPAGRRQPDYKNKWDVIAYFETWAQVLAAREFMREHPGQNAFVNGLKYKRPKRDRVPLALDENPAAGTSAA